MTPDFIGAFVIGLLGAGHCMGMCGGLGALLTLNHQSNPSAPLFFYNFGRIGSYMLFGAIVGGLTASLSAVADINHFLVWLRLLAAVLMIGLGLYVGRWWFGVLKLELWANDYGNTFRPQESASAAKEKLVCPAVWFYLGLVAMWIGVFNFELGRGFGWFFARRSCYGRVWFRDIACDAFGWFWCNKNKRVATIENISSYSGNVYYRLWRIYRYRSINMLITLV